MIFSPEKRRYRAFEPEMLKFHLETKYDPESPMGNVGLYQIDTVVSAWLVGLHQEIAPALPPALEWLDEGIATREEVSGSVDGHRSRMCAARAIGTWLLDGSACEDIWHQALLAARASWITEDGGWPDSEIRQWGLDEAMAYALLSGSAHQGAETAIELCQRYTRRTRAPSVKRLSRPREFAYALALRQLGQLNVDEQTLLAAGRRMLTAGPEPAVSRLQDSWFGRGQFTEGAMWLKLVYSLHQPPLTPLQTILRAYDNMPDVPWPDFMPAELKN